MIELKDITKVFHAGRPNEFSALRGISLSIEAMKTTILKGPSGSGKTTLMSIIGCMARPTSGRVWLNGRELTSLPERFMTGIRRNTFGFVFQQFNLIKGITAVENAMLPAYPGGKRHGTIKEHAIELFRMFGIEDKAHARIEWLSGGQAQRVAVARALINDPEVIIADEPTAHLDTALARELMDILAKLKEQGKTLIISSHDPEVYDSPLADTVVNIRDGYVV